MKQAESGQQRFRRATLQQLGVSVELWRKGRALWGAGRGDWGRGRLLPPCFITTAATRSISLSRGAAWSTRRGESPPRTLLRPPLQRQSRLLTLASAYCRRRRRARKVHLDHFCEVLSIHLSITTLPYEKTFSTTHTPTSATNGSLLSRPTDILPRRTPIFSPVAPKPAPQR